MIHLETTSNEQLLDFLQYPEVSGCLVVASGGLDSTIAMRLAVEKYGKDNVHAITFHYGQIYDVEVFHARFSTKLLGVKHEIVDLSFLGRMCQGVCANVDRSVPMPTILDVLGDPAPTTYVPNRNMIMLSVAASYAEVHNLPLILIGLQVHDIYNYHDATEHFIQLINGVLAENRKNKISIFAPFVNFSKTEEIQFLLKLDGNVDLLEHTISCYNPDSENRSCKVCPACAQRLKAFQNLDIKDPIEYVS